MPVEKLAMAGGSTAPSPDDTVCDSGKSPEIHRHRALRKRVFDLPVSDFVYRKDFNRRMFVQLVGTDVGLWGCYQWAKLFSPENDFPRFAIIASFFLPERD